MAKWRLLCIFVLISIANATPPISFEANPDTKRLYDDLLSNYNRLIRPVVNNTETLTVWLGLKLSQLIEVNLKNQVMTTNLWVKQRWFDYKLRWDPEEYGGVEQLYVPSEHIWVPDIVLYNNWDGNYEVTLMTKATLKYTGEVFWEPPAIYKSSCEMNVEYFPYDEQICFMKFGSWTYNGAQVDLKHLDQVPGSNLVQVGIDLTEFYLSVEWDILEVPATKNEEYYPDTLEPFSDITFKLTMRRKTLFYTVNLIVPCVALTFLTVLVFYLPSDSGEKVTLCISILVSLTVFFLLLAEIIPPTSLAVPLLGKYLLFTMILVSLSVWTTVCVLNIHFRSPSTHKMSPLVRKLFLHFMPKLMMMRRTQYTLPDYDDSTPSNGYTNEIDVRDSISDFPSEFKDSQDGAYDNGMQHSVDSDNVIPRNLTPEVLQALRAVRFIAQHIKDADKDNEVPERVRAMNASIKLLLIVREPVTRAISDYTQLRSHAATAILPLASTEYNNNLAIAAGSGGGHGKLSAYNSAQQYDNVIGGSGSGGDAAVGKDTFLKTGYIARQYAAAGSSYMTTTTATTANAAAAAAAAAAQIAAKSFEELAIFPNGTVNESYRPLTISMYHLHLHRWLEVFPREQLLVVNGDHLIEDPVSQLKRIETFLGIEHRVTSSHFYFNETKGFYCLRYDSGDRCLRETKGRKHPHVDPVVVSKLRKYFAEHNQRFYELVGEDLGWPEE